MQFPDSFVSRMQQLLGPDYLKFEQALAHTPPVSIRVNSAKTELPTTLPQVPWTNTGFYLSERPLFTLDPLLHAGAYYVQEASSMFLEQAIRQTLDLEQTFQVLDLCGAPGGKSTHLASLFSENSLIVSNEVIRSRASILAENITKWGSGNVVVTSNDPKDFGRLPDFFDVMVVDAPCSGEGMFRKDPGAIQEWSDENVKLCAQRQQRILMDVWDSLKPGGILIYSTCTWNKAENEQNIAWLSEQEQAESIKLELQPEWGVETSQLNGMEGYRFYPHQVQGEGFFMAVIRKAGRPELHNRQNKKKKNKLTVAGKKEQALVQDWLKNTDNLGLVQYGEVLSAIPSNHFDAIDALYQKMYVIYACIEVAEISGKKLKPMHALALSRYLNKQHFNSINVNLELALRYLRKEDINLGSQGSDWVLIQYKDIPLGWAKQIGNRVNNYYPKEWRIRMDLPQVISEEAVFSIGNL